MNSPLLNAPLRPVKLGTGRAIVTPRSDGTTLVTVDDPLKPYPVKLTERLVQWATQTPDATFLAQRAADGSWRRLTYADALSKVRAIGQALLDRGLNAERPVVILSENDIENALLALACYHVGIPYAPVSPSYSLLATDYVKLRHCVDLMTPGLVFAASGRRFGRAITAVVKDDVEVVVTDEPVASRRCTPFADLLDSVPTPAVDAAYARITADTVGKILFTSGTTGMPKGVILPQRMLCSNRQQVEQILPFLADEPPVLVDWLPWHHTFGGTQNFGIALWGGGSLYIDHGKPMPGAVEPTVQSLREVSPTIYTNTPKGLEALLPYFRAEPALRERFFSRLKLIYYGAATLPIHIWDAMDELALQTIGQRILIVSGLGSTETGPVPTSTNWDPRPDAIVGIPVPGVTLKLAPVGNKLEMRVKGPCVTAGYWRDPERTRDAFDEEGFFRMGDAVRFIDPANPEKGLKFDGRIAENFKLTSGTWVNVAELRDRIIAGFAPYVREAVIAGHNRDFVAALVFPEIDACRTLAPELPPDAGAADVAASPGVRAHFSGLLKALAETAAGSSGCVARILLDVEPPTLDTGEVTDKSTISQQAVLARRATTVEALYAAPPDPRVLTVD